MNTLHRTLIVPLACALLLLVAAPMASAQSKATVGEPAPEFTLPDTDGEKHSLADYEGTYVVLEWLNFGCPYVGKHYDSGHMQALQKTFGEKDVVWFSIVSSAEGKQGYYPPEEMKAQKKKHDGQMSAILMDPSGTVGKTYGARTTPHMYVINPEGTLVYKGGIDDWTSEKTGTSLPTDEYITKTATNYVETSLGQSMEGEEVDPTSAPPYGCSVKYAAN